MVITSNLMAMNAQRMFGITSKDLKKRSERLSSGYKVNRAADDAAGLAISEKMRRQIRGLNKSVENIQDGISLCQVADGALNEVHDILQRINELSVKAGNDTNTQTDREYIQMEIDALTEEIDRIGNNTTFNEDIYPLLGKAYSSGGVSGNGNSSGGVPSSPEIPPLSDSDYSGSNLQIVNASTISNYASYRDSDGKMHYQLGSGTFKIEGLTDCVFDVSGNTCIEDTDLKNVTIDCATGTILSVKNVRIDNSANVSAGGNGIGAAIKFQGAGNTLNCFGDNEFNGGLDNYTKFTNPYDNQPYRIACAGINVGGGAELTINGTDTSNLTAHGCNPDPNIFDYPYSPRGSYGIGSNANEDGGKITINSGHIAAYADMTEETHGGDIYTGAGCIGGGKGINITINGGTIDACGGDNSIGGGSSAVGSSCDYTITINGGIVNAKGDSVAIGNWFGDGENKRITINGGTVTAITEGFQGTAIGGYHHCDILITGGTVTATATGWYATAIGTSLQSYSDAQNIPPGTVNITGGTVVATADERSNAIGGRTYAGSDIWAEGLLSVDVFIDGVLTDTSGTEDGKGHKIYTYSNPSSGNDDNTGNDPGADDNSGIGSSTGNSSRINRDIWIHMATEAGVGMFISLVDATTKGLGIGVLDVSSMENAGKAINSVKHALGKVSEYRTVFGAQQNRLEHAVNINENIVENTTAAESRIRDTDIATEIMEHTKDSILQQAGVSILTQANQMPQYALQLLS